MPLTASKIFASPNWAAMLSAFVTCCLEQEGARGAVNQFDIRLACMALLCFGHAHAARTVAAIRPLPTKGASANEGENETETRSRPKPELLRPGSGESLTGQPLLAKWLRSFVKKLQVFVVCINAAVMAPRCFAGDAEPG